MGLKSGIFASGKARIDIALEKSRRQKNRKGKHSKSDNYYERRGCK